MNCKAKILDEFGGKYICNNEAIVKLTITTFAPHLQRNVITIKCLCKEHAKRTKNKYNYRIKHLHKQTVITEELITI